VANLLLEGIWDENIRTEQIAALVDPLIWNRAVSVEPIFSEAENFKVGGSSRFLVGEKGIFSLGEGV
jgi:hypothetical protein